MIFKRLKGKLSKSQFLVKIKSQLIHSLRGSCSLPNVYKYQLKVSFFVHFSFFFFFLSDFRTNVLLCHRYCNIKLFDCSCVSNRMKEGQTPAKTLFIHFRLHLLTNKQWQADFKILYISFIFTNITILFMKSISQESTIINIAIF